MNLVVREMGKEKDSCFGEEYPGTQGERNAEGRGLSSTTPAGFLDIEFATHQTIPYTTKISCYGFVSFFDG